MDPLILTYKLASQLHVTAILLYDQGSWWDLATICSSACSSCSSSRGGDPSPLWQLGTVSVLAACLLGSLGSSQTSLLPNSIQWLGNPCSSAQILGGMRCCCHLFANGESEGQILAGVLLNLETREGKDWKPYPIATALHER